MHPNIVPFIGVPVDRHALRMVSEWMPNGTVRKYLIKHSGADRIQLVSEIILPCEDINSASLSLWAPSGLGVSAFKQHHSR